MPDNQGEIDDFLQAHPQILLGRETFERLEAELELGDTFTGVSKPVDNMIVYQIVNADTKRAIAAVALIDDERAMKYYKDLKGDGKESKCTCPDGDCSEWRLRCYVCAFANEEPCKWDRKPGDH